MKKYRENGGSAGYMAKEEKRSMKTPTQYAEKTGSTAKPGEQWGGVEKIQRGPTITEAIIGGHQRDQQQPKKKKESLPARNRVIREKEELKFQKKLGKGNATGKGPLMMHENGPELHQGFQRGGGHWGKAYGQNYSRSLYKVRKALILGNDNPRERRKKKI